MKYRRLNIALSLCCVLGVALPVWAHAHLESTNPSAGARLNVSPKEITIRFAESIEPALSVLKLLNAKDVVVPLEHETDGADKRHMSATVPAPLSTGYYRVKWKALSQDGHPVTGEFDFTVSP